VDIFLTTDTHFGHDKLVELSGRPVDFSEKVFRNLQSTLQPHHTLIHLGDIAMGVGQTMASSGWTFAAGASVIGGVGFGICYLLKDYIIGIEGNNLSVTNTGSNYTPLGSNPVPTGTAVNP